MSYLIGRGRTARETYPEAQRNASDGALLNRNVAIPTVLDAPFTPATGPSVSIIAAIVFTPKVSGVIQVTALLDLGNGETDETYSMQVAVMTGTNLTVTGGESTSNGWVMGSTTPPIVGGTGVTTSQLLGSSVRELSSTGDGDLNVAAAVSQPVGSVGVPIVIQIQLLSVDGDDLDSLSFTSLSVLELP